MLDSPMLTLMESEITFVGIIVRFSGANTETIGGFVFESGSKVPREMSENVVASALAKLTNCIPATGDINNMEMKAAVTSLFLFTGNPAYRTE